MQQYTPQYTANREEWDDEEMDEGSTPSTESNNSLGDFFEPTPQQEAGVKRNYDDMLDTPKEVQWRKRVIELENRAKNAERLLQQTLEQNDQVVGLSEKINSQVGSHGEDKDSDSDL
jgi:hypothetical protein